MSELRIGKCSCGAQLISPFSSDVNAFLESHNVAHNGIKQGEITGDFGGSPDSLAQIAESLERLADIAEINLRAECVEGAKKMSVKEMLAAYISPKGGE